MGPRGDPDPSHGWTGLGILLSRGLYHAYLTAMWKVYIQTYSAARGCSSHLEHFESCVDVPVYLLRSAAHGMVPFTRRGTGLGEGER